jgi:hypothetical protein
LTTTRGHDRPLHGKCWPYIIFYCPEVVFIRHDRNGRRTPHASRNRHREVRASSPFFVFETTARDQVLHGTSDDRPTHTITMIGVISSTPSPTLSVQPYGSASHMTMMLAHAIRSSVHDDAPQVPVHDFLQWLAMGACLVAICHSARILSSCCPEIRSEHATGQVTSSERAAGFQALNETNWSAGSASP